MKKKFLIKGMSCASCVSHVERAVKKLEGVSCVTVSLLTNTLELETSLEDAVIISAVKKAGFKASVYDIKYKEESNIKKGKLILSVIFLFFLLYIAMGPMLKLPLPYFLLKISKIYQN